MQKDLNKFLWVMFGGAVWDALGAPVEFKDINTFDWIDAYKNSDDWEILAWERTDDTSMSLCLAESLLRRKWFDIVDQLDLYLKWYEEGYMSLKEYPLWIWNQTVDQLSFYKMYKEWILQRKHREDDFSGLEMEWNWSLMRIWPIVLFYANNYADAVFYWWESSKSTHHTDICIDCCKYYTGLVWWAIHWYTKEELLKPYFSPIEDFRSKNKVNKALRSILEWSYKDKKREELIANWYVVNSLEVALWWFFHWTSFEEWMEMVVNLWDDADTNWCIYWFLAGAYYWYDQIPARWKENIAKADLIRDITKELFEK